MRRNRISLAPNWAFIVCILIAGSLILGAPAYAVTGQLLAGTGKISLMPETDEPIHDPIYARSLVLEINGLRLAFVSVDLAVFSSDRVEQICREKYGITKVFLCASHNHTAPSKPGKGPGQANLKTFYEDQTIRVVESALKDMFPARIAAGRKRFPQLGFKRLVVREDGHARESWTGDDHYAPSTRTAFPLARWMTK